MWQLSLSLSKYVIIYRVKIIIGSLSNVGVRADGEQNSCPEGTEVSEAEGEAFEGFNGVVAALSKSVGQVNVECVQDVWPPVSKHSAAGPELWEIQLVAGFQPEVEPVFGFGPGRCCHEVVERLLEGVCLQKLVGKAEHYIHGDTIFLGEPVAMGEQQSP